MRKFTSALVVGASVAALAVATQQTSAAVPADAALLAAVHRDLGLTSQQFTRMRQQQEAATELDGTLRTSLGADFGGSWFDRSTGKLVVNVTDPAAADDVTKTGALARVVEHGETELTALQEQLNTLSRNRSVAMTGVTAWHVDPKSDSLVVTVVEGTRPAVLSTFAARGAAVRVEYVTEAPRTTRWLNGGERIKGTGHGRCSAGFNLVSQRTREGYLLTAGHCVTPLKGVEGDDGIIFGTARESHFPRWDHALVRNENPGYWEQGPYVQYDSQTGAYLTVTSVSDLPVGSSVCKSGFRTGWTCGTIMAKNESVKYGDQSEPSLYLTRTNACSEPGDSGGSVVGITISDYTAEGMTSGGALVEVDGQSRCLSVVGEENVSYYYPAKKALEYYTPRFDVVLM